MKNIKLLFSILVGLLFFGCYKESDYNKPIDTELYKTITEKDSIQADGFSTVKITAEIPGDADEAYSKIIFTTTAGVFVEGGAKTLTLTAKKAINKDAKIAEVVLRSSLNLETANISVEFFNLKKNIEIKFSNSYPDKLKISSSSLAIKPLNTSAGEVNVDGLITRTEGSPSIGNIVDVTGYDSLYNKKIGSFRVYNNKSNDSGKTSYVFVLGDSIANNTPVVYLGNLYLVAKSLKNNQNQFIADTIKLISSR